MISGSKGQKVVRACTIRLLNLGPSKHEKVAIYAVNQRISNVWELRELLCNGAIRGYQVRGKIPFDPNIIIIIMTSKGHKSLLLSLYLQIALKDIFLDEIFTKFFKYFSCKIFWGIAEISISTLSIYLYPVLCSCPEQSIIPLSFHIFSIFAVRTTNHIRRLYRKYSNSKQSKPHLIS